MLYQLLKILVWIAMKIFCRHVFINRKEFLRQKGPLLLAVNHPNSFLDAVILDTLFNEPIWSLARGDVFEKPVVIRILTSLRILPVYRVSEGVENLGANYETFTACKRLFQKNAIVLIFSEGRCINEWHLRPLKKGTARLAISSWEDGIDLTILPVGINYSSFRRFGKNLFINFGNPIREKDVQLPGADGARIQLFNHLLQTELQPLVFEIKKTGKAMQSALLEVKPSPARKILLSIPALAGYILHAPLYIPVYRFTFKRTNHNDHFDSVLIAILLFTYPVYLLALTLLTYLISKEPLSWLLLIILPLLAWSYVQLKPQLDKV